MRTTILILAVLIGGWPGFAFGDAVDDFVEGQMAQRQIPGLAFAVVRDGEIVETRFYGLANVETKTPVSAESVFEIASLTKPLTAAAVLKLVDSGIVALTDPVTKWVAGAPPEWNAVTVEHLLSHTGGFAEQLIVAADGVALMDVSTEKQFGLIAESPLMFPAGAAAAYSDPGYFLLGMVIEAAGKQRYADAMQGLIFDRCGMERSSILDQWRIVDGRVAGYTPRDGTLLNARRDWQHELPSFFGVMTTVGDLARFEIAYDAGVLMRDDLTERMQTATLLADGRTAEVFGRQYGLGWQVGDYRGYRTAEHGGFSGTHLLRFPDEHFAVIVLTNLDQRSGSRPDLLARGIAGLVDSRFLRPDMMALSGAADDSELRRVVDVLHRAETWAEDSALTEEFRRRWSAMPPRVQAGRGAVLGSLKDLRWIAMEEPRVSGLTHFGVPVREIRYYRGQTAQGEVCVTVWVADDARVQDVAYYRP